MVSTTTWCTRHVLRNAILQIELDVLPEFNCSTRDPRLENGMIREGQSVRLFGLPPKRGERFVRVLMQVIRTRKEYRPGASRWPESTYHYVVSMQKLRRVQDDLGWDGMGCKQIVPGLESVGCTSYTHDLDTSYESLVGFGLEVRQLGDSLCFLANRPSPHDVPERRLPLGIAHTTHRDDFFHPIAKATHHEGGGYLPSIRLTHAMNVIQCPPFLRHPINSTYCCDTPDLLVRASHPSYVRLPALLASNHRYGSFDRQSHGICICAVMATTQDIDNPF